MPADGKWYAVLNGREGTKIYLTWPEAERNVSRFPGAIHKSFRRLTDAEDWLATRSGVAIKKEVIDIDAMDDEPASGVPVAGPSNSGVNLNQRRQRIPVLSSNQPEPQAQQARPPPVPMPPEPAFNAAPAVHLSDEQQHVLDLVKRGKNVFFTGSAGTGKSVLLREIIKWCRSQDAEWGDVGITASTGIASINIGGCTLHSWAGIGLGKEPKERLVYKILGHSAKPPDEEPGFEIERPRKANANSVMRWRKTRVLIIDEISMIDGYLFDKLEYVARAIRRNSAPFGGLQLVLSGDFCQLPPVPDQSSGVPLAQVFAFEAKCWNQCVGKPIFLTKVFRQKEQHFVDMLNAMRYGNMSPEAIRTFRGLSREVHYTDGIEPTDLFPTRMEVEGCNSKRLAAIKAEVHRYRATDRPGYDENGNPISKEKMEKLLDRLVTPATIDLKVGTQVMMTKNISQGCLVNGSVGKVVDFLKPREAVERGIEIAMSKKIEGDRAKPADHLLDRLLANDTVWPVVHFNVGTYLCVPESFEVNGPEGQVEAQRLQVPLILAWALSIHKSQGQTLERVRVNLARIFEKGQAYVALSRATSIERLQVLNFDPAKIMAHPRVLAWMKEQSGSADQVDDDLEFWAEEIY